MAGAERSSFTASVCECGPGGANGVGVVARGQAVVARRGGLRDGGLQRRHRTAEQRKLREAQRKLTDGPYLARGVMASVRGEGGAQLHCSLLKLRTERTKTKPVRFFTRISNFRLLARASRTLNVQWMAILGVPLRRMIG